MHIQQPRPGSPQRGDAPFARPQQDTAIGKRRSLDGPSPSLGRSGVSRARGARSRPGAGRRHIRREDHGHRPQGHAGGRAGCPAMRRRPPVELRRVRLPRTQAAVRPERLRRDPARALRVRREADGGELHDRGPQQWLLHGRHARSDDGVGKGLPGGHGLVRADADDGHLVRPPRRRRAQGIDPQHQDATRRTPSSCRSRRRRHRFWKQTCARAGTGSTASGWCRGSG